MNYNNDFRIKVMICIFVFICSYAQAQIGSRKKVLGKTDTLIQNDTLRKAKIEKQKDVTDIINKGVFKIFFGKPDTVLKQKGKLYTSLLPAAGYSLHTKWAVSVGANGAFYTDEIDKVNLSVVNIGPTYTLRNQFICPVQSNIWSKENKYNFLGNWIFYKFPENTFGLGGHTSLKNADAIDYNYILIRQTFLKSITHDFFLGLGYNLDYHWNITEAGNSDGSISDFQKYGFANKSSSSGITFNILYDTRRNPLNPPKGYYANIIFRSNFIPIGSDKNWQSVLLDFRKYFKLSSHSNNVLAVWSYNWFTLNGTPPYLDLPSTAWDTYSNQGRGYIQSRFRGKNLIALEAEYRFGITSNGLFGGVIFTNAQSVSEFQKNNFEVICPGAGAGMRIKVNKHSDTNVAIDYAVGNGGSRGFFVNLGEVF